MDSASRQQNEHNLKKKTHYFSTGLLREHSRVIAAMKDDYQQ